MRFIIEKLEKRVKVLEEEKPFSHPHLAVCPAKPDKLEKASDKEDDDEDIDLFGSDSEASEQMEKKFLNLLHIIIIHTYDRYNLLIEIPTLYSTYIL